MNLCEGHADAVPVVKRQGLSMPEMAKRWHCNHSTEKWHLGERLVTTGALSPP